MPPTLRAESEAPPVLKRPWHLGIGPAYLTIFVWAPFFDPLWSHDLSRSSLPWLAGSAIMASLICFAILYYPAAICGYRTGRGLGIVATSTFGTAGSDWLTGIGVGAAELVWYGVAINYGVEATLLGLVTCGIIAPDVLGTWDLGPFRVKTPVFLCTSAFWIFITGSASLLRLIAVIAALMKVYAPVAFLLLTGTAIWMIPSLNSPPHDSAIPVYFDFSSSTAPLPGYSVIPVFTGFFAMVGLLSVNWGAAAERKRDVTVGGLAGIVLAGSWTAIMSLLVVAGAASRLRMSNPAGTGSIADPPVYSFRWGVLHGVGGYPATAILILFGLAALAPACYSIWIFSRRVFALLPRVRRIYLTWGGGAISLLVIATTWLDSLDLIYVIMGLLFAPMLGAILGDYAGRRGEWGGIRRGVNPPGPIAWLAGVAIGLLGQVIAFGKTGIFPLSLQTPILGIVAAAGVYWMLARIGWETPFVPLDMGVASNPNPEIAIPEATKQADTPHVPTGSEPPRA